MVEKYVEVIEDGKIVSVPESYALAENLPILKKAPSLEIKERVAEISERKKREVDMENRKKMLDNFSRPLDWKSNNIINDLVENFHWLIIKERKARRLTRKQLALMINETEDVIKTIEYGRLPSNDFIIINKLQNALGIRLRKDEKEFNQSFHELNDFEKESSKRRLLNFKRKENGDLVGSEIKILEE